MPRPAKAPGYGRVRLIKRGPYFYARFMADGKRKEVPLRITNRVPAEAKAREINDTLEKDQPWEWAVGRPPIGAKTFAEIVDDFLEKGCNWAATTRASNAPTVLMLVREFGHENVSKIGPAAIEGYLARRRDGGLKVSSCNRSVA
jgi:hypothetical protein